MGSVDQRILLTEAEVTSVARELAEYQRTRDLEQTYKLGRLVLERCYGGSIERWRRGMNKNDSIRRVADHPDCPFQRTTLNNAVAAYELCSRMPEILEHPGLKKSHVYKALALSPEAQQLLLMRAAHASWSARRLEEEIRTYRREHENERRGAPPATAGKKAATYLRRCSRQLDAMEGLLLPDSAPIADDAAQELHQSLSRVIARATELRRRVSQLAGVAPDTWTPSRDEAASPRYDAAQ